MVYLNRKLFLLLLLVFSFNSNIYPEQSDVALDIDLQDQDNERLDTPKADGSLFKWAWEMKPHSQDYAYLKSVPWLEPNGVVEAVIAGQKKRELDNSETYAGIGYFSFRPFVLDFGDSSIAFGASFIGRIARTQDIVKKIVVDDDEFGQLLDVEASGIRNNNAQTSFNFSMLASFPSIGLQILADVGYGFGYLRQTSHNIDADILGNVATLSYDEYQYKQHDQIFFGSLNIFKSFDRPFFNHFHVFIAGYYRDVTTERKSTAGLSSQLLGDVVVSGKQDLEFIDGNLLPFPDPQQADEFNFSNIGVEFTVRIYTFYLPFVPNRGISIGAFGGVRHVSGQLLVEDFHGFETRAGVALGIFDALNIRLGKVWESGNQQEDAWELTINLAVSGILRQAF